jgi:hypothetical protein
MTFPACRMTPVRAGDNASIGLSSQMPRCSRWFTIDRFSWILPPPSERTGCVNSMRMIDTGYYFVWSIGRKAGALIQYLRELLRRLIASEIVWRGPPKVIRVPILVLLRNQSRCKECC